ncbi:LysR family transcriptional regulator [Pseudomonas sp. KBW05]|uniref:LysR family transcriptional regulator n=1 Tax=Pseudomonas sp. KBW05 TaxID=2153360 RepID=UPI000F5AA31D|nr:LysR family transcriptional regulator [Pseudomonas sp. KBW05]RQO58203.1 LysR family transcriptional regulator [Pseudomonas sp. KBW05]
MDTLQFDGIPEFILAAQLGSFTAAALQLGVTSSAVGKSVSRLEKRLGIKLLHRTTRKLNLTHEGEVYLASCLRIMEELRGVEGSFLSGVAEPKGRLRIDLPAAFGRRHIAPMLIALARRYAQLDLTITFGERKVDMVNDGIDLAVRIGDLRDDPELVARRLGEQRLVICAAPQYLQAAAPLQSKADLLVHDCIIGWRSGLRKTWLLTNAKGVVEEQEVRVRHEFGDGEVMLQATLDGAGLCQLPTWLVAEHLRSGALVTVLDDCAGATMPIHVIWPHTRYVQPKVRVVVDALLAMAEQHSEVFGGR